MTPCDMLEAHGMSDAHYKAHIHINEEPRCERSQKNQIRREQRSVLSNSSSLGADRAPWPPLLLPMLPKMCYEA